MQDDPEKWWHKDEMQKELGIGMTAVTYQMNSISFFLDFRKVEAVHRPRGYPCMEFRLREPFRKKEVSRDA